MSEHILNPYNEIGLSRPIEVKLINERGRDSIIGYMLDEHVCISHLGPVYVMLGLPRDDVNRKMSNYKGQEPNKPIVTMGGCNRKATGTTLENYVDIRLLHPNLASIVSNYGIDAFGGLCFLALPLNEKAISDGFISPTNCVRQKIWNHENGGLEEVYVVYYLSMQGIPGWDGLLRELQGKGIPFLSGTSLNIHNSKHGEIKDLERAKTFSMVTAAIEVVAKMLTNQEDANTLEELRRKTLLDPDPNMNIEELIKIIAEKTNLNQNTIFSILNSELSRHHMMQLAVGGHQPTHPGFRGSYSVIGSDQSGIVMLRRGTLGSDVLGAIINGDLIDLPMHKNCQFTKNPPAEIDLEEILKGADFRERVENLHYVLGTNWQPPSEHVSNQIHDDYNYQEYSPYQAL